MVAVGLLMAWAQSSDRNCHLRISQAGDGVYLARKIFRPVVSDSFIAASRART